MHSTSAHSIIIGFANEWIDFNACETVCSGLTSSSMLPLPRPVTVQKHPPESTMLRSDTQLKLEVKVHNIPQFPAYDGRNFRQNKPSHVTELTILTPTLSFVRDVTTISVALGPYFLRARPHCALTSTCCMRPSLGIMKCFEVAAHTNWSRSNSPMS